MEKSIRLYLSGSVFRCSRPDTDTHTTVCLQDMSRYGCMGWMSNGRFLAQLFLQHINSWLVISGIKTYHVCINEP